MLGAERAHHRVGRERIREHAAHARIERIREA